MTEEQIEEIKIIFSIFDKDGVGSINTKELGHLMRCSGHDPTEAELKDMINEINADDNGTINFPNFLSLLALFMARKWRASMQKDQIKASKVIDCDGKCNEDKI